MISSKNSNGLPKVGTGSVGNAPSEPASTSSRGGAKSKWWKTQRSTAQDPGFERLSPQWSASASDEMERFKRVPVVGRLSWKWQYVIAAFGLMLGVILMAMLMARLANGNEGESQKQAAEMTLREAAVDLDRALWMARTDPDKAGNALMAAVSAGRSAAKELGGFTGSEAAAQEWEKTAAMVEQVNPLLPHAQAFRKSVLQARPLLANGLSRANSALLGTPQGSALDIRAFLASMMAWSTALDQVAEEGTRWPEALSSQRSAMNAAVNGFSSSPAAGESGPASMAWRQAGGAWAQAAPSLQAVVAEGKTWNQLIAQHQALRLQIEKTLGVVESSPSSSGKWLIPAMVLTVAWVGICLVLLMFIGWKQQRLQALQAIVAREQTEAGILNLMEDLRIIADGDLTHRARLSETPVSTMADMLNDTVMRLATLVKDIKTHVERGASAAQNAASATNALVDSAREDQDAIVQSGNEIARVVEGIRSVGDISTQTKQLADEASGSAANGRTAVQEAHTYLKDIRDQSEEARNRVERLAQSSREIAGIVTLMNEIADGIGVLAMQAALQAARAGEKGQGFRVVADGVGELAQKSGVAARRVGALVETALGDIEGAAASMRAATQGTDESMRLMDISLETSQVIEEVLLNVTRCVGDLLAVLQEQNDATQVLDANTKESLSRVQDSQHRAEAASASVMELFDSSREMASSANRFKV